MRNTDGTPGTQPTAREIAELVTEMLMAQPRKIEAAGRRVNIKPRRPAGYTYIYLDRVVGLGLSGREWDLVFTLASRADQKGLIVYSAGEIRQVLHLEEAQLHRGLRRILQAGILERVGRGALRLNPRMLWHGSSSSQVLLLSERIADEIREGWDQGEP